MGEAVRLSETSRQTVEALARFDEAALERLLRRLESALAGELEIEREPVALVEARQRILAEVLVTTEQNINLLRRLRVRKVGNEWEQ
jgi:hypothetical protein